MPDKLFSLPKLPQKMIFAGQEIILKDEDIRERLDREVLSNAYYQSSTIGYFKRAHRWFPVIERILKEEGVPDDFKYLAVIESGLQQAVSPVGAQGFWQFMPETAQLHDLEMSPEVDERLNIVKSTRAACEFIRATHDELHDWLLTAAAYNRGLGGVQRDMEWQGTSHYFDTDQNSETGRYVFRILAVKMIFEHPETYGYDLSHTELYNPYKTREVVVSQTIPDVAEWALQQGVNFKIVQKLNPWLKTNRLTVRQNYYNIILPAAGENLKPYKEYLQ